MRPTVFVETLSNSMEVISLFLLYDIFYQWIIFPHFPKQTKTQLTESLFDSRETCIFMKDLQTDIPGQTKSCTDCLVLNLLQNFQRKRNPIIEQIDRSPVERSEARSKKSEAYAGFDDQLTILTKQ